MDFFEIINKRESCRDFAGKAEKEKLLKCVEAARLAPSSCNGQPWSFIVVCDDEAAVAKTKKAVQDGGMNRFCEKCDSYIIVVEEKAALTSKIGGMIKRQDYKSVDIGIAAAHIAFAATEQGLSTCILGWFDEKALKDTFKIDAAKRVRLVIACGYAADKPLRVKKRKTLEEICDVR